MSRQRAPDRERSPGFRPAPRSLLSGSHTGRPASSSSLLFSCTGVNSLVHLTFHWFPERIFPDFVERHAVHGNLFHSPVVQLIPFAQEIRPRLRIRHHRDHPVRCSHNSIQPQGAHLQSRFSWWQIRPGPGCCFLATRQRFEGITPRDLCFGRLSGPGWCRARRFLRRRFLCRLCSCLGRLWSRCRLGRRLWHCCLCGGVRRRLFSRSRPCSRRRPRLFGWLGGPWGGFCFLVLALGCPLVPLPCPRFSWR